MTPPPTPRRRVPRDLARAGATLAAAFLVVGIAELSQGSNPFASAAAQNAGAVQVQFPPGTATAGQPLNSGGSATAFALTPPAGAACTGDSATGGYRVQTYMVPAAINPATLTFDANGPIPGGTGASYRQPLFSFGTPFVNATTAVSTGLLTGLPAFSFELFGAAGPQIVPAGVYNLGYACTVGLASATQLDKYWNVQLTFAVTPSDVPSGITWTVGSGPPPTTTTVVTTTTTAPATTTTVAATTTTTAPATTTTVAATTTTAPATTTTTAPATTTTAPGTTTTVAATTTTAPAPTTTAPAPTTTSPAPTTTAPATTTTAPATTTTEPEQEFEHEHEHEGRPRHECGDRRYGRRGPVGHGKSCVVPPHHESSHDRTSAMSRKRGKS